MTKLPPTYHQFQGIDERLTALETRVSLWEGAVKELLAQRNKARRVAKTLVGPAKHLKVLGHDLTADELKAIDTALAYPGREP